MNAGQDKLLEVAVLLAARLPVEVLGIVARAVSESPSAASPAARTRINQEVPHPYYRDIATDFLNVWRNAAADMSPQQVAAILLTAAKAEQIHRKSQTVELVWTGPETDAGAFRRTEQAILQVLDSAQQRITLVSYAVYAIPNICEALVRAARRQVQIRVIVETPNLLEGKNEYDTIQALGADVASCAAVYYWPEDQRGVADSGKVGILHVKCAVADGEWLFLSSANLTQQAFTINMELGILVRGGTMPSRVEQQFERLIQSGQLKQV